MPYIGRLSSWREFTVVGLSFKWRGKHRMYFIARDADLGWQRGVLRGTRGVYS